MTAMPLAAANKRLVLAYVAAFNAGDLAALRLLFTEDAEVQGVLGWGGLDVALPVWRDLHESFAVMLTVESLIAEGEMVAARYTERGHFRAPFRGQPATGRSYELVAMEFFTMRDGLIHRRWGARDSAGMARQLGLVPV